MDSIGLYHDVWCANFALIHLVPCVYDTPKGGLPWHCLQAAAESDMLTELQWRVAALEALHAFVTGPCTRCPPLQAATLTATCASLLQPTLDAICAAPALQVCTHIHTHAHMYIHICIYSCIHVHIHTHVHILMYTCTCTCMYTYHSPLSSDPQCFHNGALWDTL